MFETLYRFELPRARQVFSPDWNGCAISLDGIYGCIQIVLLSEGLVEAGRCCM
jgi:hypothetical protein